MPALSLLNRDIIAAFAYREKCVCLIERDFGPLITKDFTLGSSQLLQKKAGFVTCLAPTYTVRISTLPNITWSLKYTYLACFQEVWGVAAIFHLYQPVWSTDSCPHIGEVQHAVPEESVVRLLGKPASALVTSDLWRISTNNTTFKHTLPVHFLGGHGEIYCVTWSLVRPGEKSRPTGQQLGDLHNSLLVRLVTSKAAHLNPRESVHLRGRRKGDKEVFLK